MLCPSCNSEMKVRTSTQNGNKFWGCSRFPACKYTVPIDSVNSPQQIRNSIGTGNKPWTEQDVMKAKPIEAPVQNVDKKIENRIKLLELAVKCAVTDVNAGAKQNTLVLAETYYCSFKDMIVK